MRLTGHHLVLKNHIDTHEQMTSLTHITFKTSYFVGMQAESVSYTVYLAAVQSLFVYSLVVQLREQVNTLWCTNKQ